MNDSAPETERDASVPRRRGPTERVSITQKMLDKAAAGARSGKEAEILDAACRGLELRARRGGSVAWTLRTRVNGNLKRFVLGDHTVTPDDARERAWRVKAVCRKGTMPFEIIAEFKTGVPAVRRGPPAVTWETAVDLFLREKKRTRRHATWDDYRSVLLNTPELKRLAGRAVSTILARDIGLIYADIHQRSEAYSEHVARVVSSLWGFLANLDDPDPGVTAEQAAAIRLKKAPERTRIEHGEKAVDESPARARRRRQIEDLLKPPTVEQVGRVIAIAKGPALSPRARACLLLTAATAQRRRTVAALNHDTLSDHGQEVEWAIPPAHRKTANKQRSKSAHRLPLVGWAAHEARVLRRLTNGMWLFPAGPTDGGKPTRFEHVDPGWVTKLHSWIPGGFNPHRWRKALSTYGEEYLGWTKDDAKLILDHMEGHDSGDVTAQHYGLDPKMQKKREMLAAWQQWLDQQAAAAVEREPWLSDVELVREKIYRARYGDEAWKRAIARAEKSSKYRVPWKLAVA